MGILLPLLFALTYEYYLTGDARDVQRAAKAGMLLAGGGGDVDDAHRWLLAKSGGGDVVVLRASGADGYNKYLYNLSSVDSVESFVIKTPAAAADAGVAKRIRAAEMIFIAGGDQWNYVRLWKNGPIAKALNDAARRGVPIGGTSAGLAVLGEYSFSAEFDSVRSAEALADPYHRRVAIARDFLKLPHLSRVITDSHFSARDRMGRMLVFLARIAKEKGSARGLAVDERTALAVERDGSAQVYGGGAVYFLRVDGAPEVCEQGRPLSLRNVRVQRVTAGGKFNLKRWDGGDGERYTLRVLRGTIESSRGGIY